MGLLVACGGEQRSPAPPPPPVILISIDTLRSDHLPAYGYAGVATPHLDAFRRDSVLFERAYSHAPLTLPSHASLMTGKLPPEHGVRNNIGYTLSGHATLASRLKAKGYVTGAAVSSYVLRSTTGISHGFDFYEDSMVQRGGQSVGAVQRPGAETVLLAQRWLDQQRDKPAFLFLHLFEPHTPYEAPEPYRTQYPTAPYDAEIAAVDAILGSFIGYLKRSNLYERSLIIVLSDHGEGLGDHGEDEHGIFLYREALQVPLLVKLPHQAQAATSVSHAVSLASVMPAVLSVVESPSAPIFERHERSIYGETYYPRIHLGWSELRSVIDGDLHLIDAPRPELYDLRKDPSEKDNLAGHERRNVFALRETTRRIGGTFDAPQSIDPEEAAKLAALGYLAASQNPDSSNLPDPKDRIVEIAQMNAGIELARRGKYSESIHQLLLVLRANPRLTDAWTHLGRAYESIGDFESAADAYRRSIELAPSMSSEKALSLAAVYLNLQRLDEAKAHAELAVRANPSSAHVLLGRVALARRDLEAASREANLAAEDSSARPAALVLLAQVALIRKQFDEAMALVNDAERLSAEPLPLIDYVRGNVHALSGRPAEAEAAFGREIEKFPQQRETYAALAVLQLLQGKGVEAERTMERLVRANPSREAFLFAAQTFSEMGDGRRAEKWRRRGQ